MCKTKQQNKSRAENKMAAYDFVVMQLIASLMVVVIAKLKCLAVVNVLVCMFLKFEFVLTASLCLIVSLICQSKFVRHLLFSSITSSLVLQTRTEPSLHMALITSQKTTKQTTTLS